MLVQRLGNSSKYKERAPKYTRWIESLSACKMGDLTIFQETGVVARKIVTSSSIGSMPSFSSKTQVSCSFKLLSITKSLQPDDSIFGQFDWISNNFARQLLPLETRRFTMVSSSFTRFLKKSAGISCKLLLFYWFLSFNRKETKRKGALDPSGHLPKDGECNISWLDNLPIGSFWRHKQAA